MRSNKQKIEDGLNKIDDAVVIITGSKEQVSKPFVIMFYDELRTIIADNKLNMTDLKILLGICKVCQFGNNVVLNQGGLASSLGFTKSQMSNTIKRLKENGILIQSELSLFINPSLIVKGKLSEIEEQKWLEAQTKTGKTSPLLSVARKQQKRIKKEKQNELFTGE